MLDVLSTQDSWCEARHPKAISYVYNDDGGGDEELDIPPSHPLFDD